MRDGVQGFLESWHKMVVEKDLDALPRFLAEDISLGAPPYFSRFEGRETVCHLLGLILHTIEGFTYHREWREGRELALEFHGRVGELDLQGIDLITLNDAHEIQSLDVLIRPVNAVEALQATTAPRMAALLARRV